MKESKLKKRLLTSYLSLVFAAVAILVVFIFLMARLHTTILSVRSETIPIANINNQLNVALSQALSLQNQYELTKSREFLFEYNAIWRYQILPSLKNIRAYITVYDDVFVIGQFNQITDQLVKLGQFHNQLQAALRNDSGDALVHEIQRTKIMPLYHKISNGFIVINRYMTDKTTQQVALLTLLTYTISALVIVMIVLLIVLAIWLNHKNVSMIISPIKSLLLNTKRIMKGKWEGHVDVVNTDEIGQLTMAFNIMRGYLHETRRKLRQSERILSQQKAALDKMAHNDLLTGLANRRYFEEVLDKSIASAVRHHHLYALLFLDLDGFKAVNDHYGHKYGDALLIEVSLLLKKCLRTDDTLSRWGGDEFGIILSEIVNPSDAGLVANKIIQILSQPIRLKEYEVTISASIGIVVFPTKDQNTAEYLLKLSDQAMYEAKKAGKGQYRYAEP